MHYVNCSCFPQSLFILHTGRTMIAKTAGNCCEGNNFCNICACAEEKKYRDICLEQLFCISYVFVNKSLYKYK